MSVVCISGSCHDLQIISTNSWQVPSHVLLGWRRHSWSAAQVGYYGLFVDGSFEHGMSRPAATFENPCLASAETFEVDAVECWRVQPPTPEELEEAAREGNSVLDKYASLHQWGPPGSRLNFLIERWTCGAVKQCWLQPCELWWDCTIRQFNIQLFIETCSTHVLR